MNVYTNVDGGRIKIDLPKGFVVFIDAEDFDIVSGYNWYAAKMRRNWYAQADIKTMDGKRSTIKMHRVLLPTATVVDHKDGCGLNNTRANIRAVSKLENSRNRRIQSTNTSGFKGVSFSKSKGKWTAMISVKSHSKYLGTFDTPIDAAKAYNKAAKEFYGDFARLNEVP